MSDTSATVVFEALIKRLRARSPEGAILAEATQEWVKLCDSTGHTVHDVLEAIVDPELIAPLAVTHGLLAAVEGHSFADPTFGPANIWSYGFAIGALFGAKRAEMLAGAAE